MWDQVHLLHTVADNQEILILYSYAYFNKRI